MSTPRTVAGLCGALAVALGAFGAHALRGRIDVDQLETWKTASMYHLLHSVVLLAMSSRGKTTLAFRLIATGTVIFSGSLYLLVVTQVKKLGAITPIGGLLLIAGWVALIFEE